MLRRASWSRNGFLAYVDDTTSSHNLLLTYLENVDGRDWQLARPQELLVKPLAEAPVPVLSWVQWSNLATDLAIFDEFGNFYILLAGVGLLQSAKTPAKGTEWPPKDGPSYELTSYNHTEMIFRDKVPKDLPGNLSCVAFEWLPMEKPQVVNRPAQLGENGTWSYSMLQINTSKLAHPIATKQACVALRVNGTLDVYYQGEHKVEYYKLQTALTPGGENDLVIYEHASIGFLSDKSIVVAAYDALSKMVYVYNVAIDWGFLTESAKQQRSDPHYHTPKEKQTSPKLTFELLQAMFAGPSVSGDIKGDVSDFRTLELCLISVLSPISSLDSLEVLLSNVLATPEGAYTTVNRYVLEDVTAASQFADFGDTLKKKGECLNLVLKGKLNRPYVLAAVKTALDKSMILLIDNHGQIEAVQRSTWSLQQAKVGSSISSLLDCGLGFPSLPHPPAFMAVSPNMTTIAYLHEPMKLEYSTLIRQDLVPVTTLCAGLAHTHAFACYYNTCSDDIVMLLRELTKSYPLTESDVVIDAIMREAHMAVNFQLHSFGKESVDKLLSNPPLQKLLLLQLMLGELHSDNTVMKDIAWVIINIRSASFGIMFTLSSIYRQISKKKPVDESLEDSINRAEGIMLLVGNVKWLVDMMIYLNQELLQLSFVKQRPIDSKVTLNNSIALPLIMAKVPRLFIMYALSSIAKTCEVLKKLHKDLSDGSKLFAPMKDALSRFSSACNSSPLNLTLFEAFLRDCETQLSKEPNDANLLRNEQLLFNHGKIPESKKATAAAIVDRYAASVSRELRILDMYFYDCSWVDVGAASRNVRPPLHGEAAEYKPTNFRLHYSEEEVTDVLRKVIIQTSTSVKLRKCARCRSVSYVSDPLVFDSSAYFGLWTMVFQRTCICGSAWVSRP